MAFCRPYSVFSPVRVLSLGRRAKKSFHGFTHFVFRLFRQQQSAEWHPCLPRHGVGAPLYLFAVQGQSQILAGVGTQRFTVHLREFGKEQFCHGRSFRLLLLRSRASDVFLERSGKRNERRRFCGAQHPHAIYSARRCASRADSCSFVYLSLSD